MLKEITSEKLLTKLSKVQLIDIREPYEYEEGHINKSILIDLLGEGWKFKSNNNSINLNKGLYFGKENFFEENQNLFISGMTNAENQTIKWELTKL